MAKKTNKVVINGNPVIDLTQDSVTAADVKKGKTFHLKNGEIATGSLDFSKVTSTAADVASGKKFFDQEGNLQTGTKIAANFAPSQAFIESITGASSPTEDEYVTVLPEGLTTLEPLQSYTYQYGDYDHPAHVWLLYEVPSVSHHKVIWPDSITSVSTNFYWTSYNCPISSGYWHIYLNKNNFEDFIRLFCDGSHSYYTDHFYSARYFDKSSGEQLTNITFPEGITTTYGICLYHSNNEDSFNYSIHFPSTLTCIHFDLLNNSGGGVNLMDLSKVTTPPEFGGSSYWFWSWTQIVVPQESLDAYKSATGWCDVADYIFPYPSSSEITFYINDVEYTCAGGTTWRTFAAEHSELNINIDSSFGNISNLILPTEDYYVEVADVSYILSNEHYVLS